MTSLLLGIDIGGTKVAVAAATLSGSILASRRMPTQVELGPENITERIIALGHELLAEAGADSFAGVGIGCGGPLDLPHGLVMSPPNLPGWDRFPLRGMLEEAFACPATLDNDANAAALGELWSGAGRGYKNLVYLTISTGIGGGVIVDGQLLHGVGGCAGEVGHQTIVPNGPRCNCGNAGCLEALASGMAIARRMREKLSTGPASTLVAMANGNPDMITAEMVARAARQGDALAGGVWQETAQYLALGVGNIICILAPEIVILGGGVAQAGEQLLAPVRSALNKSVFQVPIDRVRIVGAELGSDSGVYGAVYLALAASKSREG